MWNISKQVDFCYGHRVWSQKLDERYSIDNKCVCRHLHGHQGAVHISLSAKKLKDGMVTDFKHLNWFKKFIDEELDHKFIIDKNDPLFDIIIPRWNNENPSLLDKPMNTTVFPYKLSHQIINAEWYAKFNREDLKELYEGFVIVNFVPTSENLAKWLADIVEEKMKEMKVTVHSVEFCETPKTSSTYSKE